MDRVEIIYKDEQIEVRITYNVLYTEYALMKEHETLAVYYGRNFDYMHINTRKVRFEHLKKFHEVVADYLIKKGE